MHHSISVYTMEPTTGLDLWERFQHKADELFVDGFNLSTCYYAPAIEKIEGKLVIWREKLPKDKGNLDTSGPSESQPGSSVNEADTENKPEARVVSPVNSLPGTDEENIQDDADDVSEAGSDPELLPVDTTNNDDASSQQLNDGANESDTDSPTKPSPTLKGPKAVKRMIKSSRKSTRKSKKRSKTLPQGAGDLDIKQEILDNSFEGEDIEDSSPKSKRRKSSSKIRDITQRRRSFSPRQCGQCSKLYTSDSGFRYHMQKHSRKAKGRANNSIPSDTETPAGAGAGSNPDHNTEGANSWPRTCPHCPKAFKSHSGYKYHVDSHQLKCSICDFQTTSKDEFSSHNKKEHSELCKDILECIKCKLCFISETERNIHATKEAHYPIICFFCPKKFFSMSGYRLHRRLHTGDGISCDQCDYVGGNLTAVKLHVKKLHLQLKEYLCDICAKACSSRSRLNEHKISAHMRDHYKDKYRCEECPYTSHSRNCLKAHVQSQHRPTPGFMCDHCGQRLTTKASLRSHQQRHNGNKTFSCHEKGCDFKAICVSDVQKHVRRKHNSEPQDECQVCRKRFKCKSHVRRHMVVHTGGKQFACDLCSYKCNVKSNLRKHIVTVHKITPERERPVIQKFIGGVPVESHLEVSALIDANVTNKDKHVVAANKLTPKHKRPVIRNYLGGVPVEDVAESPIEDTVSALINASVTTKQEQPINCVIPIVTESYSYTQLQNTAAAQYQMDAANIQHYWA